MDGGNPVHAYGGPTCGGNERFSFDNQTHEEDTKQKHPNRQPHSNSILKKEREEEKSCAQCLVFFGFMHMQKTIRKRKEVVGNGRYWRVTELVLFFNLS